MRKLHKLKNWYSLPDAANRLTLTLGEEISVADILQLTLEGHLPLSWNMRYVSAVPVAPYCRIHNWDITNNLNVLFGMPVKNPHARIVASEGFYILSDTIEQLEGYYTLDFETCAALKDWVYSLITHTGGELISLDGYFVKDQEGSYWKIMERFPSKYPASEKKPDNKNPISQSFYHIDNYYPSGTFPDSAELGFIKADIEAFEEKFTVTQKSELLETTLNSRERDTLLKLIIGMAVVGYRYDPKATKSDVISDIKRDLSQLGIPISDDTIRGKLKEAQKLLPPEPSENPEY